MQGENIIWDELHRMQDRMDSLFNSFSDRYPFFGGDFELLEAPKIRKKGKGIAKYRKPFCDFHESKDAIVAEVEIPGVDKKDIKVNISEDSVEIKAELKAEILDKEANNEHIEKKYLGFYRKFSLPSGVDTKKAVAKYKEGILKISIPKLALKEGKSRFLPIK